MRWGGYDCGWVRAKISLVDDLMLGGGEGVDIETARTASCVHRWFYWFMHYKFASFIPSPFLQLQEERGNELETKTGDKEQGEASSPPSSPSSSSGARKRTKEKAGPKSFAFHFVWLTVSVCGRGSEFNGRHGCQMWWICARHRHWQNKGKNHGKTNSSNNTASDLNFLTTRGAFHLFSLFLFYSGTQL